MNPFLLPLSRLQPQRLDAAEVDAFARRTGWVDDVAVIDAATSCVERTLLPWWSGVDLMVARDPAWPGAPTVAAWLLDDHLNRLTGDSAPIHAINQRQRPVLDEHTVLPYLGFFCLFMSNAEGPFLIVDGPEDAVRYGARFDEATAGALRPAALLGRGDDGFRCEATVWYAETLYLASFQVRPDGNVLMTDDEPVATVSDSRCTMRYVVPTDPPP